MSTKSKVLQILLANQGEPISGEKMATTLNLSRTAIWKGINELKKEGHNIRSTTNRGYDYLPSDVLSREEIDLMVAGETPPLTILIEEELASTNQTLKKMAIDGQATNTLLLTNKQTATRGRFGRPYFVADNNQGIYLSLLLHTNQPFAEIAQYTLITAVAMARAIEEFQGTTVEIKWVNDLYMNGKKVAGILSEAITDFETQTISSVIIGVGVNFAIPQADFPRELQERATSVFPTGLTDLSRNQLIASFLRHFYQLLDGADNPYIDDYRQRSFVLGKEVTFTYNRQAYQGLATDITTTGELVVTLPDGKEMTLSSGEISLTSY